VSTRIGTKGWAVLEAFAAAAPEGTTRAAVAESVGCTTQRVGEVLKDNEGLVTQVKDTSNWVITPARWKALSTSAQKELAAREKAAADRQAAADQAAADRAAKREAAKAAKSEKAAAKPRTKKADKLAEDLAADLAE